MIPLATKAARAGAKVVVRMPDWYPNFPYNSGLLLGVNGMSTSSGAQVLQWTDNGTADHPWRLTSR